MQQEIDRESEGFSQLQKVTPLSKYLALGIFISMPFMAGWIGYNYAPEKIVEVQNMCISAHTAQLDLPVNVTKNTDLTTTKIYEDPEQKYRVSIPEDAITYTDPKTQELYVFKDSETMKTEVEGIGDRGFVDYLVSVDYIDSLEKEKLEAQYKDDEYGTVLYLSRSKSGCTQTLFEPVLDKYIRITTPQCDVWDASLFSFLSI